MTETAEKTDPALWDKVKNKVQRSSKGGKPGQWSARKAQLAVHDYKEEWGTKSGQKSGETGERYLPKKAREKLSPDEYKRSTAKKRADTKKGKQFSAQPKDVAAKTADTRRESMTVAELREQAAKKNIAGRSKMNKAELLEALKE